MKHLSVVNPEAETMSSLEIANLCGKRHDNVIRDLKNTLQQVDIDILIFEGIYTDSNNREHTIYNLPRRECDLVVSGYSAPYRLKIIDRWHELELSAPKAPTNYIEALEALVISEKAKQLAIDTKAEIGSRREATSMNTASQAVKKANKLERELDRSKEYCSIKRMQMLYHGQKFKFSLLRSVGNEMDIPSIDIFDANYGTVKAYHNDVWLETYGIEVE